jgi:hypothetical protein
MSGKAGRFHDPEEIERALAYNRARREEAKLELAAAREVLQALLVQGHRAGLPIARMARAAGVSRDTVLRLLQEAGRRP